MKKTISILLVLAMILGLAACSGNNEAKNTDEPEKPEKVYTEYNALYDSELKTIDYLNSTVTSLSTLAYNCQEGLIGFDGYGLLRPRIAKNWSISADGTVYTFYLRDDVVWVDNKGQEAEKVKAQDFVTAAEWILNPDNGSTVANTLYNNLVGAKAYFDGEDKDFSHVGIKALDDTTVQYTLLGPSAYFLRMLGNNVWFPVPTNFLAEHKDTYGTSAEDLLYCGAYFISSWDYEYERVLEMNPLYMNVDDITIKTATFRYNKEATSNGAELFLRGDTDAVNLSNDIAKEWKKDSNLVQQMHPAPLTNMSYWMAFNFDPNFDEKFDPATWKIAVNNENFRKSFFYGFNPEPYTATLDEWNYQKKVLSTFTRADLVSVGEKDYRELSGLDQYSKNLTNFDSAKALDYKAKAMEELSAKGVSFPIKVMMTYNVSATTSTRYQVLEQQLENLLGTDYIDIILEPYNGSSFNKDVRNAGNWAFMELGWGPDYADPMSQFDPVLKASIGKNWGKVYLAEEYLDAAAGVGKVEKMALEADAIKNDFDKRYEAFAAAEKELLDEALVIPAYRSGGGYMASKLVPFTATTGQMGDGGARNSIKFAVIGDHSLSEDEYNVAYDNYIKARAAARAAYVTESASYQVPEK